ncbi:NDT80 / PhoG like DNA-binding family protein [Penicillium diatomitis]|uniref:NDT80 / PhoG like DNA-binding family protein n=1 Tax=Penicillium diatomitis TaxID=2819901 RepID=A0A9W9X689_9EURO|nr:NDT80 / PhoG like DNA-binding family protein [Penicillium diatomitis]KAJ5485124.1 NDT80 / PhoG like DNA-binding family protein [Penicillium diatomitis]
MSTNMQSPIHSMGNNTAALMGRNHVYSAPFTIQRSMNMPLNGMNDLTRGHGYSGPPQAVEIPERNQAVLLQPSSPESSQRSHSAGVEQPAFEETSVLKQLIADFGGTQQIVKPEIHAKFVRGPFPSEDKWTCYRRNYLSVTCSVSLQPWAANLPLYLRHGDRDLEPIHSFSMGISAIVNGNYEQRVALVQHTPKRDKQSEHSPPRVIVQPIPPISLSSSNGNGVHGLHLGSHSLDYNGPFPGATQPPQSHLFERIQFQKATANNGKRRAQQQFYNLVVELYAEVSGSLESRTQSVLIARRHSESLVVRGRSPGHYRDGRRDSTASSGPGSGPDGRGGDGSVNSIPSQALGAGARQQPMLYDSSPQGSYTYARVDYRHMPAMEHSPVGDSPLAPSSSSSGFDYAMGNDTMNPLDTLKPGSSLDPYQDVPDSFPGVSSHPRSAGNGFDPVYSSFPTYSGMQNNRG